MQLWLTIIAFLFDEQQLWATIIGVRFNGTQLRSTIIAFRFDGTQLWLTKIAFLFDEQQLWATIMAFRFNRMQLWATEIALRFDELRLWFFIMLIMYVLFILLLNEDNINKIKIREKKKLLANVKRSSDTPLTRRRYVRIKENILLKKTKLFIF